MTFDREPDLDNANVGMPEDKSFGSNNVILGVTKSVAPFFVFLLGGEFNIR